MPMYDAHMDFSAIYRLDTSWDNYTLVHSPFEVTRNHVEGEGWALRICSPNFDIIERGLWIMVKTSILANDEPELSSIDWSE